jgi:alpha-1,3-rhamnosyltransferase
MTNPLVSVIIPSYNHERYVEECLYSILLQDYSNFEVIIIDDGSKDNTALVIEGIAEKHGNVTFLKNELNLGLTATLNKALKHNVRGKYIIQIASDDKFFEGRIRKQVEFMERHPEFGMAYAKAYYMDENSTPLEEVKILKKSGWLFDDLFLAKFNMPAYTCIYKAEVFEEVGYYDEGAFIEDSEIWYKISKKYQIGFIDTYVAYYRRHNSNMSKRHLELYRDTFRRLEKYKDEPKYNLAVSEARKHWFFLLSFSCKKESLKLLPQVIINPFNKFFVGGILNHLGFDKIVRRYVRE